MAKKAEGRVGKAEIEPTAAGEGGGRLPKARTTIKQREANNTLILYCGVELEQATGRELYRLLRHFRYKWDGKNWVQVYPDWLEFVRNKGQHGLFKVKEAKHGETEK